jgi:hypothetical protein
MVFSSNESQKLMDLLGYHDQEDGVGLGLSKSQMMSPSPKKMRKGKFPAINYEIPSKNNHKANSPRKIFQCKP